jgi:uncharacterized membrane protein
MYLALAAAVIIVALVVIVPYRRVSASAYNKARAGAFLMLVVPAVFLAMVIFEIHQGTPFLRDLIMTAATAFASIYVLIRVLLQGKPSGESVTGEHH